MMLVHFIRVNQVSVICTDRNKRGRPLSQYINLLVLAIRCREGIGPGPIECDVSHPQNRLQALSSALYTGFSIHHRFTGPNRFTCRSTGWLLQDLGTVFSPALHCASPVISTDVTALHAISKLAHTPQERPTVLRWVSKSTSYGLITCETFHRYHCRGSLSKLLTFARLTSPANQIIERPVSVDS